MFIERMMKLLDVLAEHPDLRGIYNLGAGNDGLVAALEAAGGEVEPIDPVAGHVPGAFNRPFAQNLRDGRFKPADELHAALSPLLGTHAPTDVVLMCGSGVTACHLLLAMESAGLSGARIYADSWSGWVSDSSRPVATGA